MSVTTAASSPKLKAHDGARCARFVGRDTGNIFCPANAAICLLAKTAGVIEFNSFVCSKSVHPTQLARKEVVGHLGAKCVIGSYVRAAESFFFFFF